MRTTIEGYPVAFAIADTSPEPVSLFLYDLPGCGVQAKSFEEGLPKLQALVPEYLRQLKARGVALPDPSPEPAFQFEQMAWAFPAFFVAYGSQVQEALKAAPTAVIRRSKPDGVQQVEIGEARFASPVPA